MHYCQRPSVVALWLHIGAEVHCLPSGVDGSVALGLATCIPLVRTFITFSTLISLRRTLACHHSDPQAF